MSITEYTENNEQLWKVYVNIRSKTNFALRLQKRINGLKSKASALQEEKKTIRSLSEKITEIEQRGVKWRELIEEWEISERKNPYRKTEDTTFKDCASVLNRWTKPLMDMHAREISRGDIRQLLKETENQGRSRSFQATLKVCISSKGLYQWGL